MPSGLAEMQVESGAFDYVTAIRNAVRDAAQAGTTVLYPTGHTDKLDVAIRRAVLTGVSQTSAQISERYADDMGCDLVETTAHVGARPSHQVWQGKVFSRSESGKYPDFKQSTGYGTGAGLCGWNCRHSFFPFFEGLSESAYPRDVLDEYNRRAVAYNGQEFSYYDATQMQRAAERKIRATKRELAGYDEGMKATGNEKLQNALREEFGTKSVALKRQERELKDFLKQTGLDRQNEREQTLGFGKSTAQKAVWANKKAVQSFSQQHISSVTGLQNTGKSGTIKTEEKSFSNREEADQLFRPWTEEVWPELELPEKAAAYEYTSGSGKFNRPLRGYDRTWDNFKGVGNVPLDNEGAGQLIEDLKNAIDKSEIKEDVWLFRGSDQQSLAGLLGIDKSKIIPSNVDALNRKFAGKIISDPAFFSTGISADAGFHDKIGYEILAPKGSKGLYVEPFSKYGYNEYHYINPSQYGIKWDGRFHPGGVHTQAEVILQADTKFKVNNIKLVNGKITATLAIQE